MLQKYYCSFIKGNKPTNTMQATHAVINYGGNPQQWAGDAYQSLRREGKARVTSTVNEY